jgi:nucleoside-diphosphate-sugar epimerase
VLSFRDDLILDTPPASLPLPVIKNRYAHSKRILDFMTRCMREEHSVDFVTVCPTNIFGPKGNLRKDGPMFEANLAKCLEAKAAGEPYRCWGSGKPVRQLLYRCVASHVVEVED